MNRIKGVSTYKLNKNMLKPAASKPLRWQKFASSPLARQLEVFRSAGTWMFYLWWDDIFANNSTWQKKRRAQWLLNTLLDLGPTFIKIGQSLSTRADLLPLEYIEALEMLQDRVPAFSSEEAIALVESELGNSLYALYRDFERFPIAAASLGQVHKARLHSGEEVIVKVQRPGLDKLFNLDFQALGKLVRFCQHYFSWTRKYELELIYDEFFKILYQEIDYVQEAKNAERFAENFKDYPRIIIPKTYWRYTTSKVLTIEYLPGIKVDDRPTLEACGIDITELNKLGICCYLKQLLLDGFFQADPHPGNMAVRQDGSLIFYDFGMMVEIKSLTKEQMIETFFAVLKKDSDAVLDALIEMGLIVPVSDLAPVKRLLKFTLDQFTEKPIDLKAFREMSNELYTMFEQQPFRLPAQMTYVLKALTTLDGIARTLDPQYNPVACAQPFVKSLTTLKGQGNLIVEISRQARDFIKYKLQQPTRSELLIQRVEERLERGEIIFRVKSEDNDRTLKRINLAIKSLIYACITGFTLLAGTVLLLGKYKFWATAAFSFSGLWFLILLRSLLDLAVKEKLDKLAEK